MKTDMDRASRSLFAAPWPKSEDNSSAGSQTNRDVYRIGDPRDDAHRHDASSGESRAGLPRLLDARRHEGRGMYRDPRRHQPIRCHLGYAGAPASNRREVPSLVQHGSRYGLESQGDVLLDRSDDDGMS